ncbi:hypothetical protein BN1051_02907 [Arthrobacter saudimassiliensis]|uniref:YetF C-terminal domain-containing protein n=1 Tax=Arthrobacter saudimassiliensis TaxID=1461584 RepID=A0A078MXH5_9MICC|nr:hypothetical protein BN1051_02907 [Arthrobacter saudimassiliensis]
MWQNLGITPLAALLVVISAVGIYTACYLMIRVLGQRALGRWSTFETAIVIALGAVLGRVVLGYTPSLAAGVIGLATMFAMVRLENLLRRTRWGSVLSVRPILLMAGAEILDENLPRAGIQRTELFAKLREAGIRDFNEVAAVIIEPTGDVSVLRRGVLLDPALIADIPMAHLIPSDLVRQG